MITAVTLARADLFGVARFQVAPPMTPWSLISVLDVHAVLMNSPINPGAVRPSIQEVFQTLVRDPNRTEQIAADIVAALRDRRFIVVLSDRKEHLDLLAEAVKRAEYSMEDSLFRLDGGIGAKARRATIETLRHRCDSDAPFVLFATASLLGEGFDMPRLDTLFLTMPVPFPGRVIQYAGRLHRPCSPKQNSVIHDYVELGSALANTMYRRRLPAYRKMGSAIWSDLEPEDLQELGK